MEVYSRRLQGKPVRLNARARSGTDDLISATRELTRYTKPNDSRQLVATVSFLWTKLNIHTFCSSQYFSFVNLAESSKTEVSNSFSCIWHFELSSRFIFVAQRWFLADKGINFLKSLLWFVVRHVSQFQNWMFFLSCIGDQGIISGNSRFCPLQLTNLTSQRNGSSQASCGAGYWLYGRLCFRCFSAGAAHQADCRRHHRSRPADWRRCRRRSSVSTDLARVNCAGPIHAVDRPRPGFALLAPTWPGPGTSSFRYCQECTATLYSLGPYRIPVFFFLGWRQEFGRISQIFPTEFFSANSFCKTHLCCERSLKPDKTIYPQRNNGFVLQTHVHGDERRAENQQQNHHEHDARSVPRRSQNARRIPGAR